MKEISEMTKKELLNELQNMERQINVCFGVKDLIYTEQLYREAEKRGYEIEMIPVFR